MGVARGGSSSSDAITLLLGDVQTKLYTLWLFTQTDFVTFLVPNICFGICTALSRLCTAASTTTTTTTTITTTTTTTAAAGAITEPSWAALLLLLPLPLRHLPRLVLFNWTNLLVFSLANQRSPEAVEEDRINKPWRPIPAQRVTQQQTTRLTLAAVPLALLVNVHLGVGAETALLFCLTWLYNDCKAGDGLWRDPIIAAAFACYNLGSLRLGAGATAVLKPQALAWVCIVSLVILTTMQVQDLKDQAGDRKRGRRTLPLRFGDQASRIAIAFFAVFWSGFCAYYWKMAAPAALLLLSSGAAVAARVLLWRGKRVDYLTWQLWCAWTMVVYTSPLLSSRRA